MTPKQRLHAAFDGQPVDRVPYFPKVWVDLAAALTGVDLCDVIADPKLALKVIIDAAILVESDGARQFLMPARKTVRDGDTVCEVDEHGKRIGVIDMAGGLATQLDDDAHVRLEDPSFIAYCHSWHTRQPLVNTVDDAKRIAVPPKRFYAQAGLERLQSQMIDYAGERVGLVGDLDSPTLSFLLAFRGLENSMLDLFEQPELAEAVMDKGVERSIERGKSDIDAGFRILRLNDSTANMNLISPDLWKRFIHPRFKTVCDELHRYDPNVKIYCHICGNVLPIAELLVDTGLDAIAPLDPLGKFSVEAFRKRVGDDIVLMGGVNTLSFIQSTPEEISAEAVRCVNEGAVDRKRFIVGSGCVVPRGASRSLLLAVAAAAHGCEGGAA